MEAKLGEHAEFSLTYTTPDNTSEFSVLRLGVNGTDVVLRVVELNVTTNPNWTMSANVGVSVVGGDTRKVNITLYSVDYNVHEGEYIARVTGSDGDGQDFFKIRTLGNFAYCFVQVYIIVNLCTLPLGLFQFFQKCTYLSHTCTSLTLL